PHAKGIEVDRPLRNAGKGEPVPRPDDLVPVDEDLAVGFQGARAGHSLLLLRILRIGDVLRRRSLEPAFVLATRYRDAWIARATVCAEVLKAIDLALVVQVDVPAKDCMTQPVVPANLHQVAAPELLRLDLFAEVVLDDRVDRLIVRVVLDVEVRKREQS